MWQRHLSQPSLRLHKALLRMHAMGCRIEQGVLPCVFVSRNGINNLRECFSRCGISACFSCGIAKQQTACWNRCNLMSREVGQSVS